MAIVGNGRIRSSDSFAPLGLSLNASDELARAGPHVSQYAILRIPGSNAFRYAI